MSNLLERVCAAHGGVERWAGVRVIEADLSSGGFAFAARLQASALRGLRIRVKPHAQRVELGDFGGAGRRGLWTPRRVEWRERDGELLAARNDPRTEYRRFAKQFRWDRLDILYFAGYALWNYLSFPFLLLRPGVTVPKDAARRRLTAHFAPEVPTHSPEQTFHLDHALSLVRHDYTALAFGGWAYAAHFCLQSVVVEGLRFYTRRKVYPRFGLRRVLPLPTLVWIELDNLQVVRAG